MNIINNRAYTHYTRLIITTLLFSFCVVNLVQAKEDEQMDLERMCHVKLKNGIFKIHRANCAPLVVVFTNKSTYNVLLQNENTPSATQSWSTVVQTLKNTALLTEQQDMTFYCAIQKQPDTYKKVHCEDVMSVGVSIVPDVPPSRLGSYWVEENQPLELLVSNLHDKGINL